MAGNDWPKRRVFLRDPYGPWAMCAREVAADERGKLPKIKGRDGQEYFVAPCVASARVARQFAVRPN